MLLLFQVFWVINAGSTYVPTTLFKKLGGILDLSIFAFYKY